MENKMFNKTLVIGGAGYIGGVITDMFPQFDVFDNLTYEDRYFKKGNFIFGDVRDLNHLDQVVHNYDSLIILAGLVGDAACSFNPEMTHDINVKHVEHLAKNYKGKIFYVSTCSVYGKNDDWLDETSPVNPLSIYAETKLLAEKALQHHKPDTCIFRLGTLFGTGDNFSRPRLDLVVNILTTKASQNQILTVFGGEQWRPLLHVKDVGRAMGHAIENNLSGIYNLCYQNFILKDVAEKIIETLNKGSIRLSDLPFEDFRNYKVSAQKILDTGWKPQYTLTDGIMEIHNIIMNNRIKNPYHNQYHNGNFLRENKT
jgi:nucleoside-diphosphate-sugar epimerase